MKPTIAFVVSDIDGTLLTPDKSLTARARAAVEELGRAGVAFSLVSGRPPRAMLDLARELGLSLPFAGFNGGNIVRPDGGLIAAKRLGSAASRLTLELFEAHGLQAWVFADDEWYLRDPAAARVAGEAHAIGFGPTTTPSFEPFIDRIDKIVGVCDDPARLAEAEALARRALGENAAASRSHPFYLDVTHPAAEKGAAVRELCAAAGVELAHTAVIGDMANDVTMFDVAGFSVAMGQSPDTVKARADAVTAANTDEGFARAIEEMVLPRAVAGKSP